MDKTVLIIHSCKKYQNRRDMQKTIWLDELTQHQRWFHVIGDDSLREASIDEDQHMLVVPTPDDYAHLPNKHFRAVQAIHSHYPDIDYIMKTDDDMLANVEDYLKLATHVLKEKRDYGGKVITLNSDTPTKEHYSQTGAEYHEAVMLQKGQFCIGQFFFLSAKAISILLNHEEQFKKVVAHDDHLVGHILLSNGASLLELPDIHEVFIDVAFKGMLINLNHRTDRLKALNAEKDANPLDANPLFKHMMSRVVRFSAINGRAIAPQLKEHAGEFGAAMSHLEVLKILRMHASKTVEEVFLVAEDDISITNELELQRFVKNYSKLYNNDHWGVITLTDSYGMPINNPNPVIQKEYDDAGVHQIVCSRSATAYLIRTRCLERLIQVFSMAVHAMSNGVPRHLAAHDAIWDQLQCEVPFLVPNVPFVTQRTTYSDIEATEADYMEIFHKTKSLQTIRGKYINLRHRNDRRHQFEELQKAAHTHGVLSSVTRFEAVNGKQNYAQYPPAIAGALGCTVSHMTVLQELYKTAKDPNEIVGVFEDDFDFANTDSFKYLIVLLSALKQLDNWFLCHLTPSTAQHVRDPLDIVWGLYGIVRVTRALSTSGYLIRVNNIPTLLKIFDESRQKLLRGMPQNQAALDVVWIKYQLQMPFVAFNRPLGLQRPSYSNIEGRHVNYAPLFTKHLVCQHQLQSQADRKGPRPNTCRGPDPDL